MSEHFDKEFFSAIGGIGANSKSFSEMLEYFHTNKPKQWMSLVESLMDISMREYGNGVSVLGAKLGKMIDDYADYIGSKHEI